MTEKTTNTQKAINRREMLKKGALAAGGAITAAAFLDGKWLKPIVKTGVLPVHAQASCPFVFFINTIEDKNPLEYSGTADLLVISALDQIFPPGPADVLVVSGPISYEIVAYTGFSSLTPTAGQSGTLIDGYWNGTPIIETFTYANVEVDATVTVKWTFNGCTYVYTYDIDWVPSNVGI
jgi:hypothetical protein